MIEVQTYPEKETIYIDFGYKGIPRDIPIKSIEIRDPPDMEITVVPGEVPSEVPDEAPDVAPDVTAKPPPPPVIPEVKQQLQQFIVQADDITFGKDLGGISQVVQLDESYERYGLQTQTNDLLDELLSTIPNAKRTTKVLNTIHLMIERFKELRDVFSVKDIHGNPINL